MALRIAVVVAAGLAGFAAGAGEAWLPAGLYEVTTRVEMPHLERYARDRMVQVCLGGPAAAAALPVPVLSANMPFAECAIWNPVQEAARLSYDIVCPGRDAARAHASYRRVPDGFRGRIAMVMGAKNMTMTEVQAGRRVGDCAAAAAGP